MLAIFEQDNKDTCKNFPSAVHSVINWLASFVAPFSISSPTSDTCRSFLELYSVEEMDYLLENKVQESQSGSFVCLLCGVVIKVRNNLRRHFRLRHVEQRERFRCPPCDKVLPNRSALHNHIYRKHPDWKVASYDKFAI